MKLFTIRESVELAPADLARHEIVHSSKLQELGEIGRVS
jgi:hypothetical protein